MPINPKLWRVSTGQLIRVPPAPGQPNLLNYPFAGQLLQGDGAKICGEPPWAIGQAPSAWGIGKYHAALPYSLADQGSLWTPQHLTITEIADLVDCDGCGQGAAAALNGTGPHLAEREYFDGSATWDWGVKVGDWHIVFIQYTGPHMTCVIRTVGFIAFWTGNSPANGVDARYGGILDSILESGDCCTLLGGLTVCANGGSLTFEAGDST